MSRNLHSSKALLGRFLPSLASIAAALALLLLLAAGGDARAQTAARPGVLSAADVALFTRANESADRNDWRTARSLAAQGNDPVAKLIIEWRYLSSDRGGAGFQEIADFLNRHPDWPRRPAMLARAEEIMPPDFDPYQVIGWYGERKPATGYGGLRLGEALIATGRAAEGAAAIRQAWIGNTFSAADETRILNEHGGLIGIDDQRERLIALLARNDLGDARRQVPRADNQTQRLADARMQLRTAPATARRVPELLDPGLRNDPWLLFDQARAFRRNGDDAQAWSVLQLLPAGRDPLSGPDQWWTERHIMTRDALKVREFDLAYRLAANHSLQSGVGFADGEFLAGWIALRYQNRPEIALGHFQKLAAGVNLPISRARAGYWTGRAEQALGHDDDANASYAEAAAHATTFYGQLALARLEADAFLRLDSGLPDDAATRAEVAVDERVRALQVLVDLDRRILARTFAVHLAAETTDPGRYRFLAEFMSRLGDTTQALRIAKLASYDGVMLLPYLDPIIPVPPQRRRTETEPALVLGLTRQESEFEATAVSTAGARGLMQLMPQTARATAGHAGLPYRENALTSDPQYNMQLGMTHLSELLDSWGGSYILAIASYNAGSGNVRRWIETYGDPRDPENDPIDWIELIPFGETRNYVQRVLENLQVYRSRLAGGDHELLILADLARPYAPAPGIPVPVPAPR